jgi:hypothetical protein
VRGDLVPRCINHARKRRRSNAGEFLKLGKVLLVVGDEHLRDSSTLYKLANKQAVVKHFKMY